MYLPKLDLTSTEFGTRLVPDPARALKPALLRSTISDRKGYDPLWLRGFKVIFLVLFKKSGKQHLCRANLLVFVATKK